MLIYSNNYMLLTHRKVKVNYDISYISMYIYIYINIYHICIYIYHISMNISSLTLTLSLKAASHRRGRSENRLGAEGDRRAWPAVFGR